MMDTDNDYGRSLRDGLSPSVEPASSLAGSAASIPSAGDWAVVKGRSYGHYLSHDVAQICQVKTKTAMAKVGFGRRLKRVSLDDLIVVSSEEAAKRLCQALDGVKGEAQRRERAAVAAYKQVVAKIYASAIEARRAETRSGSVADESAVPQADAPTDATLQASDSRIGAE